MVNNRHGWDEVSAPTNYPGISKEARKNRHILIKAIYGKVEHPPVNDPPVCASVVD
ncbi:MAG TPA: hypothetical protein VFI02_17330 [Armatimonadota bacterium]|nr:hypothetical protein [Armatimonadota bacterium]